MSPVPVVCDTFVRAECMGNPCENSDVTRPVLA